MRRTRSCILKRLESFFLTIFSKLLACKSQHSYPSERVLYSTLSRIARRDRNRSVSSCRSTTNCIISQKAHYTRSHSHSSLLSFSYVTGGICGGDAASSSSSFLQFFVYCVFAVSSCSCEGIVVITSRVCVVGDGVINSNKKKKRSFFV